MIKLEKEKDIQLLKAIAKVGFITDDLLIYLDINKKRLNQHIQTGNIIDLGLFFIYGNLKRVYILSNKAKYRMRSEFLINPYKTDTTQLEHDYCLAKIYLMLKYKEKESWLTETMLKIKYPKALTTTDAMFLMNDKKIGVEVISDSYTKEEIKNKMKFITLYCDDYIMIHTHKNIDYTI